jgi:outer membrane protein assembly factor BamD (BamD/ComL family)
MRTLVTRSIPLSRALLLLLPLLLAGCTGNKLHLVKDGPGAYAQLEQHFPSDDDVDLFPPLLNGVKPPWEWEIFNRKRVGPPPADILVLRGEQVEPNQAPVPGSVEAELAGARDLFRQGQYAAAERVFRKIANNTKNPPPVAEEARFYEAECLYWQYYYPKAADTYNKLLQDFPSTGYRQEALQRMFDIANYWLEGTRKQMQQAREKREGKRWFVEQNFFHWDRTKPLLDIEGRAIEKLEQVRFNDITGPLADRALFLMGGVKFFNEDYAEADHHFSQLVEMHPNSPFAAQAIELAIISKHMSTGGADYDGRKVAEARQLVHTALMNYPELAKQKEDFLQRQMVGITLQQAEKDYKIAEFYRRTGHPCSAYFYYEIVRRRYPGTKYFDLATERMHELRAKVEKEQGGVAPPVPPAGGPPAEQAPQPRPLPPNLPETAPQPRPLPGGLP